MFYQGATLCIRFFKISTVDDCKITDWLTIQSRTAEWMCLNVELCCHSYGTWTSKKNQTGALLPVSWCIEQLQCHWLIYSRMSSTTTHPCRIDPISRAHRLTDHDMWMLSCVEPAAHPGQTPLWFVYKFGKMFGWKPSTSMSGWCCAHNTHVVSGRPRHCNLGRCTIGMSILCALAPPGTRANPHQSSARHLLPSSQEIWDEVAQWLHYTVCPFYTAIVFNVLL